MGRFTDPIVNLLRSMGVLFSNPPSGQPNMSGINWDAGFNPVSLQAPDGSTKSFPGAVGPGTGDVNGPASAAIGSFAIFSATTGKLIGELTIAQFYELLDDRMRDVIQPGTNITSIVYDDALGTLTINAATQGGGGGGGLPPNGTYGNIVVSGSTPGTIWTIADAQVVNSMFAPMAANSVKANITGGSAPPTDVLLAAFQAWIALVANNLTTSTTVAPSKDAVNTALGTRDAATALVASNLATHTANVANPHSTTAAQVGLGSVTNESKATMFTNPVFSGTTTLGQDAASALQAVTLQQLQAAALQVGKRGTARTASVANINLAAPGATLNGVTMVAGDVFLAKDQTAPAENGPYVWNGAAVAATRSPQFDTWVEFPGSQVAANEGTVDADTLWLCVSNDGGTLGTTAISWTKFNIAGALLIVNALSELSGVAGTALTNLGFSAFFAGLRTAANAAALQTAIGLVIGTNVQAADSTLTNFAALTIAANQMLIGTGADTPAVLAIAANQFAVRASTGNIVAAAITDFALTLLDDANAANMRTTLGLVIGTNVQAYDADLDAWALKTAPSGTVIGTTDAQSLSNKTYVAPVMSGVVNLGDGAELLAATAMAALAIDVTKGNNTKLAIVVDSIFTYSALPAAGTFFYATFANTDSAAHVMTMPANTTDYNSGVTGTVPWILPAGTRRKLLFESDGTNLIMYGSTASPPALSVNVSAAKTFTLADANVQQVHPAADTTARVFTIPANASVPYPVGTKLFGPNEQGAGALTIAITTDTIALAGSAATTGSRTVATGGLWVATKTAPTKWMVGGPGVT